MYVLTTDSCRFVTLHSKVLAISTCAYYLVIKDLASSSVQDDMVDWLCVRQCHAVYQRNQICLSQCMIFICLYISCQLKLTQELS